MNQLATNTNEDKTALALLSEEAGTLAENITADKFNAIVNTVPPQSIVREHPLQKGVKYIPIDKVETLLTKIFQQWYVEILSSGQLLNSVYVTVRLHYLHPIRKEWLHQDGIGAMQIQVNKGETASNLAAIKPNAIMLGLPAAKSYAIKDAAEHIGKLFGRDLNRKDTMAFTGSYSKSDEEKKSDIRNKVKGTTDENTETVTAA